MEVIKVKLKKQNQKIIRVVNEKCLKHQMWKNAFSAHADICCSIFEKQKLLLPKDVIISLKRNQISHTSSKHQSHFWSSSRLFVLQAVVIEL